jgi:hypothetical protein
VKKSKTIPLALAAQRLGVSWTRAWRLVLTGQLEGSKIGGRWVVSAASIERAVEDGLEGSLSPRAELALPPADRAR